MTEETSLDIAGVGKLAKAIPQKAWVQMVDTACKTFTEILAPITATTSGTGRLITAKFDRLVDAEKVLAADTMAKAQEKIAKSNKKPSGKAKANVVITAIEVAGKETDTIMRELWSNLLAQEILTGGVHPEFPNILARLSATDTKALVQIASREQSKTIELTRILIGMLAYFRVAGIAADLLKTDEADGFEQEHLASLNLIHRVNGIWSLSFTGKAFIQVVSDSWGVPQDDN